MQTKKTKKDIDGILLLDKHLNISSNSALQKARHLFNAKKAGHAGTLDPLATGLLPIFFGKATKFIEFTLNADKKYLVTAKLGIRTTTSDSEGEIIAIKEVNVTKDNLVQTLQKFQGKISQIPTMFSAIKYQGKPLYAYARQGITIERQARQIEIFSIKLLDFAKDEFTLEVHCSKGTYIRTLIDDIGEMLHCGANVIALRRLAVNGFNNEMQTLEQIEKSVTENSELNLLLPIDTVLQDFLKIKLNELETTKVKQGQRIKLTDNINEQIVRLYDFNENFLGLGVIKQNIIHPKKMI